MNVSQMKGKEMLSARINFNPSVMTSTILKTQHIKSQIENASEQRNIYSENVPFTNKIELKRILPSNNINVMYVASAFHKVTPMEKSIKSLWG